MLGCAKKPEDGNPVLWRGYAHLELPVKATWTPQRPIHRLRPIRGRNHHHPASLWHCLRPSPCIATSCFISMQDKAHMNCTVCPTTSVPRSGLRANGGRNHCHHTSLQHLLWTSPYTAVHLTSRPVEPSCTNEPHTMPSHSPRIQV